MTAGSGILLSGLPAGPGYLLGRSCRLELDRPRLMGVLNVTPDSFSDGGCFLAVEAALAQARRMAAQGADLIDVGGESTRPGAPPVSEQEELDRVLPVVEALRRDIDIPISLDTTKSAVAAAAVAAGAEFVNDVSGLTFDPAMAATVASSGAGLFVMHTRGRPAEMQADTRYVDLVGEVRESLRRSVAAAVAAGVAPERIAVDPGVGFGKDVPGNLELLRRLSDFSELGRPILLGTSRKSFIGRVLGQEDPLARQAGTLATVALGVAAGARLFRVHDVGPAREAALMAWAVCRGAEWNT
ncbi:MAG: dihydropteroate synthase [Desulfuromonadales bacterium]|nr:dihydropteroate synthase [Desulfuromonadales bacterium]